MTCMSSFELFKYSVELCYNVGSIELNRIVDDLGNGCDDHNDTGDGNDGGDDDSDGIPCSGAGFDDSGIKRSSQYQFNCH